MSVEAMVQTEPMELIELPELRAPFELWEMYRLADIKDNVLRDNYRDCQFLNRKGPDVIGDIKFLLACIKKLSKEKK